VIEKAIGLWGLPNGYVLGEEAGGAFIGGPTWPISVYLIVFAVITFIATAIAPERAGKPLK
jgi:hypothetical protein